MENDVALLRHLARRYMDVCRDPAQDRRRDLWRRHNSLHRTHPLIYVRAVAWHEIPESACCCTDPLLREWEDWLRYHLFWAGLGDDSIFEPWLPVPAAKITPADGLWGLPVRWIGRTQGRAGVCDPPLKTPEDLERLARPHHRIDEDRTRAAAGRLQDAVGDIIPVVVDRSPAYLNFSGDISTLLAQLRGLEQIMWDMMDRPGWLHRLAAAMRDGILTVHREAEEAGDWTRLSHYNQAMPYSLELADPAAPGDAARRRDLWCFCSAQEFTGIGPAQFEEFMLRYQMPILAEFGLSAYGCCEDLSGKIGVLRQIPNLRRIAVSPMADVRRCAAQIGDRYVFSYRPSPSDMVGYSWDEARVRRILRQDLAICREYGRHVDITLKDVETVQHEPERLRRWVNITRQVSEEIYP
jgi:hypothetical protein